jgi:uncharacterized protein (TIGR03437 family)
MKACAYIGLLLVSISLVLIPRCSIANSTADSTAKYGKLPLAFERHAGLFVARAGGGTFLFTGKEIVMRGVRMSFAGAGPAQISGDGLLPGVTNYIIGNDPSRWRGGIQNYARVKSRQVYPGIDVVYYGNQRQLEYDIVVAPGADPSRVRLHFESKQAIAFDGDDIVAGAIRMKKPVMYQPGGNGRRMIAGRYVRLGANEIGFEVSPYDRRRPLVLDPVISYSTFLGGTGNDIGRAIAVDASGNAYIAGQTTSFDYPTLPAYENEFGGGTNILVTKLNPTGTALVYSTVIGGLGEEGGQGIAIDASGNAYVTGSTTSLNFPIVGGFQPLPTTVTDNNGNSNITQEAFVLKLNAQGTALVYSSYLGGSGSETGRAIAVDGAGNAYFTGITTSLDFPVVNPIQRTKGDQSTFNNDAFVAKVNPTGSALVYSTFLGGASDDQATAIAVDAAGNVYVTGQTQSINFPVLNAFQPARSGTSTDAFVTKINAAGTAYVYSTYLGGSNTDNSNAIAVDSSGNAYITGSTVSRDFPVVPSQQLTGTGFIAKFSANGSSLVYSKPFGGSGSDTAFAIAVDAAGNAYVTGQTTSNNYPLVNAPEGLTDIALNGAFFQVGFVTKLSSDGNTILYSTVLGGGSDVGSGIAVDSANSVYVTGQTSSFNFPTVNPFQQLIGGGTDMFVAKLIDGTQPSPAIFAGGVVNGGSYRLASDPAGAVAPGTLVAIFGTNLAPASRYSTTLPLPTTLFGGSITFNGVSAPLFYVSATQFNAQIPFTTPTGAATVQVKRNDGTSATQTITLAAVSPGIFFSPQTGSTTPLGAIVHSKDFSFITALAPAVPGEYVSIFCTGLGALQTPVATGAIPPSPPPMTTATPTVTIGGIAAPVSYSGLAAKLAGVYQVNVHVPAGVPTGLQPVVLTISSVASNSVMLFAR